MPQAFMMYPIAALGGITAGAVLKTTLVVGMAIHGRRQAKKARQRALNAIEDQTIMMRTATAVRPIVLGSARLSGPLFILGKSGPDGERAHFVLPLAGPSDGVGLIYVGDQIVRSWDADGWALASTNPGTGKPDHGFHRTWAEPTGDTLTINAQAQITLSQEAASILAVAPIVTGDTDSGGFYAGDPNNELNAYSTSVVGGKTRLQFHANRVGLTLVVSYTYSRSQSYLRVKFHDGQSGQTADSYLTQELPGRWTSDHVGHGMSYLAITAIWHPDVFPTGIPNISVEMRGERVLDTRSSTTAHTFNNALLARHLLKTRFNCADAELDDTTTNAAANACDELVNTDAGTTEARYEFRGALPTSMSPKDMLEAVLDAMMGYGCFTGAVWKTYAGIWREPTLALTDEDFANESIVVQGRQGYREMANCARARYTNDSGIVTDAPAWVSPTYILEDKGEQAFLDLNLQYVRGVHRAQRIEKRSVLQARQALTVNAAYKLGAYEIAPGDITELTLTNYGIVEKPMLCVDRDYDPTGGVRLALREVAEAIDDWNFDEATNPDPAPNTNLPDHRFVAVPVLTFASGAQFAQVLADGSTRPFLRVYWQSYDAGVESIEIGWRRAGETTWQWATVPVERDAHDIFGVAGGETYIVIARAINGAGVRSTWAAYSVPVDTSALANGGNMTLGIGANQLPNATMSNAASGWVAYMADGVTIDIVDSPVAYPVGGVNYYAGRVFDGGPIFGHQHRVAPYNAIMHYAESGPAGWYGNLQNKYTQFRMPVEAGDRVEVQTRAASSNANAILHVQTFDVNGTYTGELAPVGDRTLVASEGKTGNLTIDSLKHLWGFVDIPAGVASVSWMVECRRVAAGAAAYVSASMPYLGLAHVGQTEPTPWHPGPSGGKVEGLDAVNTAQILPEAATQVLFDSSAGGTMAAGPLTQYDGPGGSIVSIPIANTSDRDIELIATASGSLRCYFGGEDDPSYATVSLSTSDNPKTAFASQSVRVGETDSGSRHETYSLVNRAVLAPGWSGAVSLKITRVNKTNLGPTLYAQLDWHATTLRLELIKA